MLVIDVRRDWKGQRRERFLGTGVLGNLRVWERLRPQKKEGIFIGKQEKVAHELVQECQVGKQCSSVERESARQSVKGTWDVHRQHRTQRGAVTQYRDRLPFQEDSGQYCWPCTLCFPVPPPRGE